MFGGENNIHACGNEKFKQRRTINGVSRCRRLQQLLVAFTHRQIKLPLVVGRFRRNRTSL